ncbi:MAG: insulinase family protein [Erysipelotrichaceae bacterium]|nr:insulinase family protein [Erysipelotrichaceae bacterium]
MKKVCNPYYDETYYTETLVNGLRVIIFHKPEYVSTMAAFGTSYGALDIAEKFKGKDYVFDPGVAHFLEHKLFETEDKDIFSRFSAMSCNVNAFTSYNETVYHFSTTSKDIREPLELLLDFVQDLSITEESVEREKGIIIQELAMYHEEADSRLLDETYKSLYYDLPLIHDIGGDEKSVRNITKEELELCYKLNYHPANMALVIIGPLDPEYLIAIVRENQAKKDFEEEERPLRNCRETKTEVRRKEYSFNMDIRKAKHVYAIKLKPDFRDHRDCSYQEWCENIYLKAYFSPLNPSYQKWLDEGIINDYFGYEVDFDMEYANILFYSESNKDDLKKLIDEELKKDLISEDILRQIKRRYIGGSFRTFNDISSFGIGYIRDYLNGYDFFDNISILSEITLDDLKKVHKSLDWSNQALIHIIPGGKR